MSETRTPTLAQMINDAILKAFKSLHVALPARVEKFDPDAQTVDAKPLLQEITISPEGKEIIEKLGVIQSIPVQFPGAGDYSITFPVNPGDSCLLVFADRALDKWHDSGQDVDPIDLRRHHLNDAVALLGVRPSGKLPSVNMNGATFGKDGGLRIFVTSSQIAIGAESPTNAALLGTDYRTADTAFDNAIVAAQVALTAAMIPIASSAGVLAAKPVPTLADINTLGGLIASVTTALTAFASATQAAATAKEAGSATYLSTVVKVARNGNS